MPIRHSNGLDGDKMNKGTLSEEEITILKEILNGGTDIDKINIVSI